MKITTEILIYKKNKIKVKIIDINKQRHIIYLEDIVYISDHGPDVYPAKDKLNSMFYNNELIETDLEKLLNPKNIVSSKVINVGTEKVEIVKTQVTTLFKTVTEFHFADEIRKEGE